MRGSSWHTCPMNGRPSKIRGTPEKTLGIDHGMGVVTATLSPIVKVKKQEDRVLMGDGRG